VTGVNEAAEAQIRAAFLAHDFEAAATLAVECYGPELIGYLAALIGDPDAAAQAFEHWSETLWGTLSRFEWHCSVRTWSYKLALRSASRQQRLAGGRGRGQRLGASDLSFAVAQVCADATARLRRDVNDRFQRLRQHLSDEDQSVLMLRVDRELSWRELAEVTLGDEEHPTPEQLETEATRLRGRFQLAKSRLRQLAAQEGLIEA